MKDAARRTLQRAVDASGCGSWEAWAERGTQDQGAWKALQASHRNKEIAATPGWQDQPALAREVESGNRAIEAHVLSYHARHGIEG
jgi:hypothetical protein